MTARVINISLLKKLYRKKDSRNTCGYGANQMGSPSPAQVILCSWPPPCLGPWMIALELQYRTEDCNFKASSSLASTNVRQGGLFLPIPIFASARSRARASNGFRPFTSRLLLNSADLLNPHRPNPSSLPLLSSRSRPYLLSSLSYPTCRGCL